MKKRIFFSLKNYRAALVAAVLFGCIAPGTKYLVHSLPPQSTAGILYLAAGFGLFLFLIAKNELVFAAKQFHKRDTKWLATATLFGGILGPAFLTYGLLNIGATTASLLLNLESVLTSLIAWFVFKEHFEKRIVWGMLFIIAGCLSLSMGTQGTYGQDSLLGFSLIVLACLSWGIDNNVTRNISHLNPVFIASIKGLAAGSVNLLLGYAIGEKLGLNIQIAFAAVVGMLGIGVSLVSFIVSLKNIGTARTGALFSTAPFVGSILSILVLGEPISTPFMMALGLMAIGVWFHLSEDHAHQHKHQETLHSHEHFHDDHHRHEHLSSDPSDEPHTHLHRHEQQIHSHEHFPDIHHRHEHG